MRLSILALIFSGNWLSSAAPGSISSLAPRSQFCSNAPTTVAGTLLLYPHVRRSEANNIIWCAPTGRIYVTISVGVNIAQNLLYTLLRGAYVQAYNEVNQGSDGPLPGGTFTATTGNIVLRVWNANNHQTTWGVLGAAVWAVSSFKTTNNVYGAVNFNIYDGNNQVGQGTIG